MQEKNMRWKVEDLKRRREESSAMGGPEKIARQHAKGKMTARERIDFLLDPGTFYEYGLLASHQGHRPGDKVTPADACITGIGSIDGRKVVVCCDDNTVFGGSGDMVALDKVMRMMDIATQERTPFIIMFDGAGARAQMAGNAAEGIPTIEPFLKLAKLSGTAPIIGIVMGPCAGGGATIACFCDLVIMVKQTGFMFLGGPPVVKQSMGIEISKEDLGGHKVHCEISGVADNPAENDKDALLMAQEYLSYFPNNAWEYPPSIEPADDPDRQEEELLTILPENHKRPYNMKGIINCVVDHDSFFEVGPRYAKNLITGLARMNGHPVGVVANQPMVMAGSITVQAARKERHFIDLCSAFHVPLVFLVDCPGVMIGPKSELSGLARPGSAVGYALAWADIPKIVVGIRKTFGYGGVAMCCGYDASQTMVFGWPTLDPGGLPIEPGIAAAHAKEINAADDPKAKQQELLEFYRQYTGVYPAAGTFNIDDVIDPRATRPTIIRALELSMGRRSAAPSPVAKYGIMP
jgi:acetyl-CoA carboxylase carboxyltransferase component